MFLAPLLLKPQALEQEPEDLIGEGDENTPDEGHLYFINIIYLGENYKMFSLFILVWLLLAFLLFWRPVKAFLNWLPKVVHYLGSSQKEEPTVPQKNKSPISLKFCDYIFLLRVPIIGGLILFCFPFIAQSLASRFLQNLFVMDSGIKMIMVTVFMG